MTVVEAVAALLVLGGVVGVVLPVLPGTPLIFLGALVYDWGAEWSVFGWGWLAVLLLLMLIAEGGDWVLSQIGAKRGGASWLSLLVGAVLGIAGLFLLPGFGLIIGSIIGVVGTELLTSRDARRAMRAGGGWLIGWVLSLLLQGATAVIMLGIILWQAR
ncbi:MAG: DUF456 domain-containing protein [Ardenticatenaceae bacterium]